MFFFHGLAGFGSFTLSQCTHTFSALSSVIVSTNVYGCLGFFSSARRFSIVRHLKHSQLRQTEQLLQWDFIDLHTKVENSFSTNGANTIPTVRRTLSVERYEHGRSGFFLAHFAESFGVAYLSVGWRCCFSLCVATRIKNSTVLSFRFYVSLQDTHIAGYGQVFLIHPKGFCSVFFPHAEFSVVMAQFLLWFSLSVYFSVWLEGINIKIHFIIIWLY